MSAIRVLLVDDDVFFREGVASLLSAERDFDLVGEAGDGAEALKMARELMPDVILMDISMPLLDGVEATRRIKAEIPYVPIVILTMSDSDLAMEAVRSGAQGYLVKSVDPETLLRTLRRAVRGEACASRAMAARLLEAIARDSRRTAPPPTPGAALTPREQEVLGLVAQGKSNEEIAAALAIAENTVKNHLKNTLDKLHFDHRIQAAAKRYR